MSKSCLARASTQAVKIWIGAGAALLIAGIAIWLGTRMSDDAPTRAPAPEAVAKAAPAPGTQPPPTVAPTLPGTAPKTDDVEATTYQVGNVTVHDHRGSNAGPPIDIPPNMRPPGSRTIPTSLVGKFSTEVRRAMMECTRDVPMAQRGPHARMEGEIVIAIKDNKATVTKSLMLPRDTTGDLSQTQQCLEQRLTGVSVDGQGEADLDAYSIHLQFPIMGR
jgi:hypothetical protein